MTAPDTARAFAAAEAAYLTPPDGDICVCTCDNCREGEHCQACEPAEPDWDEHEWEMRQDAKEAREGL